MKAPDRIKFLSDGSEVELVGPYRKEKHIYLYRFVVSKEVKGEIPIKIEDIERLYQDKLIQINDEII